MAIIVKEANSKKELRQFVQFNIDLYKGSPYHVPSLIFDEMATLSKEKNPAFDFCEAAYFLAYKAGRIAGRIAGIINHKANAHWKEKNVRFGFVDFVDDKDVSSALFQAVETWGKAKGMESIHGPLGFTDLDHEGLLVWGYEESATMATSYSYPYYKEHLERLGFAKDQDWYEFKIDIPSEVPEKYARISRIVLRIYGLKIVKFKKTREIWPYAQKIFELWNKAYQPLYGYSELSPQQIEYYVKMYVPMLSLDLVTVVARESDDSVIGVAIALPNLSKALRKARGRMFPLGWIYLANAFYGKNKVVDLYIIGVSPEYQSKGINSVLFNDLIPIFNRRGYVYAESNPELESNKKVQSQWEDYASVHHKTRRAFIKEISVSL